MIKVNINTRSIAVTYALVLFLQDVDERHLVHCLFIHQLWVSLTYYLLSILNANRLHSYTQMLSKFQKAPIPCNR